MTSNPKKINIFWSKVELAYKKSGLLEQGVLLEQILADEEVYGNLIWRVKSVVRAYKYGEIRKDIGALLYSTVRDLFLEVGLEWGAALRRSKEYHYSIHSKRVMRIIHDSKWLIELPYNWNTNRYK